MAEAMDKAFDHTKELEIYKLWEGSGAFTPKINKRQKPFVIIMPPPNANDPLHIGHARIITIEDVLTRFWRMKGVPTLWLPGADHAGIETQFVFEKRLAERGKSRFDYDQETLYKMIWNYVHKNRHVMENQLRQLGASCDWSRNKFTLDPEIVKVVYKTFKKLYDEGLVYRGERLVNYCPHCGTNFSDLEVNHKERTDGLYFIDYGPLSIATTRPETIFADVAVAVNPKDKRYKKLIGKTATVPVINREVPIVASSAVDMEYGTGALKITPGHDPVDFEIGQKHKLPVLSVIDEKGKMTGTPEKYVGMGVYKARKIVAFDIKRAGKLIEIKKTKHSVAICYRCKNTIEPRISKQWFVKMKPLTKDAIEAVKKGKSKFAAKKYEKTALHWLRNLKDWNISRQVTWGMRIPAWRCEKCLDWVITEGERPKSCPQCNHEKLSQDEDTFDTWFSSGQWPYATLQTTKKGDFEYFYPTTVMNTGYDIIPFWVIRMIILGLYNTGEVPFTSILTNGLVRDKEGQKISKSKGNVIDPIVMIEKYGADALRMGIIWGALVGNDVALSEENIAGQRNFANKLWNVARFVAMEKDRLKTQSRAPRTSSKDDKEILKELKVVTKKITTALEKYRLNEAAESLYDFIWNKFANEYLEKTKNRREGAQPALEYVLQETLKLAHPMMPFVTEVLWQKLYAKNKKDLLINASWSN